MIRLFKRMAAVWLFGLVATVAAQETNITRPVAELERLLAAEPIVIEKAESSRPTAKGDITLRAEVSFGGAPALRVKLRKAEPGADQFNNVPRYELAAYQLQKLFLEPTEYVVPPTALRFVPLADFVRHQRDVLRTFSGADQVLAVVQYWLNDISSPADVYSAARFESDPRYARHIGQLNILTHLIEHGDANLGNFLIGKAESGARVFSVDHGVAFASAESDRSDAWKKIRVKRLPADAVARLREITLPMLTQQLGVLAQWRLEGGRYVAAPLGPNLAGQRGVRQSGNDLQLGLTTKEIAAVDWLRLRLLKRIDAAEIALVPAPK
jgi:hypothetical protein